MGLGIFLLGWGLIPAGRRGHQIKLEAARLRLSASDAAPGLSADATLRLETPASLRAGDSALARLTFSPAAAASLPENYNLLTEARLEIPGADLRPASTVRQPLRPAQTLTFFWDIRAPQAGKYSGTAWVYLTFVPLANGTETRLALAAIPLEIPVRTLAGLTGEMSRRLGLLALLLGAALGLPLALEGLLRQGKESGG